MKDLRSDLYLATTPADSVRVIEAATAKAQEKDYAGVIPADSLAKFEEMRDGLTRRIAAVNGSSNKGVASTSDESTAAIADSTAMGVSKGASVAPEKASVKTKHRSATNVDEGLVGVSGHPNGTHNATAHANKHSNHSTNGIAAKPMEKGKVDTSKTTWKKGFDKVWKAENGFCVVCKGGKWGWVHADGKAFIGVMYDEVGSFSNGFAAIKKDGKWGFIDKEGKIAVPYKYKSVAPFGKDCKDHAKVQTDKGLDIFVNAKGKESAKCE